MNIQELAEKPAFGRLLCSGTRAMALGNRCFGNSVSATALLHSLSMNLFAPTVNDGASSQGEQGAMTVVHRRLCHVSAPKTVLQLNNEANKLK